MQTNSTGLCRSHTFTLVVFSVSSTVDLRVYLGVDSVRILNPNEASRTVSRLINHPNYNDIPFNNDIALLQLSSPVTFTNYIRPVCLAANGSVFNNGTTVWVTGWGNIQENGENSFCHFYIHC